MVACQLHSVIGGDFGGAELTVPDAQFILLALPGGIARPIALAPVIVAARDVVDGWQGSGCSLQDAIEIKCPISGTASAKHRGDMVPGVAGKGLTDTEVVIG